MKILYDHQIFTIQHYGGISRYFCQLMDQYSRDPEIDFRLALRYSQNEHLHELAHLNRYWTDRNNYFSDSSFFSDLQKKIRINALNHLFRNQRESVRQLGTQDFDLFHPTYFNPYFLKYLRNKPFVLTVYDMIPERYPAYFFGGDPTMAWKRQLIEQADAVVAISNNTRDDIIRFTTVDPDRISVVYLGNPFESVQDSRCDEPGREVLPLQHTYILFVGNRSGYKNFSFFISSIAELLKREENLHVYCAGGGPFTTDENHLIGTLNLLSRVHYIRVHDTVMKQLYKNAQVFVFPSLYEGFGLPILEAFSCGCPVVLSKSSSLPEVAGDAARYFDPNDAESIAGGIESVLLDRHDREELVRKGYERLKFFSWEKTARETKRIYDNLVHQ